MEGLFGKPVKMKPRVRHGDHCLRIGDDPSDLKVRKEFPADEGSWWKISAAGAFGENLPGAYFISPWCKHEGMFLHVGGVAEDMRVWPLKSEDWRASAWKFTPNGDHFNITNVERYAGSFLHVGGSTTDIRCYSCEPDHDGNGWIVEG
jgi:hypothetical protein